MEWGEQAHETALRELGEETGLSADIGPLLGAQSEWFDEQTSERGLNRPGSAGGKLLRFTRLYRTRCAVHRTSPRPLLAGCFR